MAVGLAVQDGTRFGSLQARTERLRCMRILTWNGLSSESNLLSSDGACPELTLRWCRRPLGRECRCGTVPPSVASGALDGADAGLQRFFFLRPRGEREERLGLCQRYALSGDRRAR